MLLHNKDAWQNIFKPNVIFIFCFCTKITGSQGKKWIKQRKNMQLFTAWSERKKERRIHLPIWILKTLIKHCALIYFDIIFHISQRCSTFLHFTSSLTFPKKTGFEKKQKPALYIYDKKTFHKLLGNWMHGWNGWTCVCVCVCVCVSSQAGSLRCFQVNFEIEFSCFNIIGHCQIVFSLPHLCLNPKGRMWSN